MGLGRGLSGGAVNHDNLVPLARTLTVKPGDHVEKGAGKRRVYSNGALASYAAEIADRLGATP